MHRTRMIQDTQSILYIIIFNDRNKFLIRFHSFGYRTENMNLHKHPLSNNDHLSRIICDLRAIDSSLKGFIIPHSNYSRTGSCFNLLDSEAVYRLDLRIFLDLLTVIYIYLFLLILEKTFYLDVLNIYVSLTN